MDKEKIIPWIEKLNNAEKKGRGAIVAEMAKKNDLNLKDAWKLLKEAGFDPKAGPNQNQQDKTENKKISVVMRHKTQYPQYRRAGLVLTQKDEAYEVTEAQLAALKKDPWVAIAEKDGPSK